LLSRDCSEARNITERDDQGVSASELSGKLNVLICVEPNLKRLCGLILFGEANILPLTAACDEEVLILTMTSSIVKMRI